jgi:hypothetical protein
MPEAIVHGAPTLWQKLSSNVPSHQVATIWTLVSYDAAPAGKWEGDDRAQQPSKPPGSDDGAA